MTSGLEQESKQDKRYQFTVFTPTYNRAYTLDRVYESLKAQTFPNFEWLIIDDGSTDNTHELVQQWQQEADFPIRYIYQENAGKHVACNRAVKEAKGEFFLIFDSDNACVPETLERFKYNWDSIPEAQKSQFAGVTALSMDWQGRLLGTAFPIDVIDSSTFEIRHPRFLSGEKWRLIKTSVMQDFSFPEIDGENFISEGIVWNRILCKYKNRYINEKLQIVEFLKDGLTVSSVKIRAANPKGARLYYKEYLLLDYHFVYKIKNIINYIRFSIHGKLQIKLIILESKYKFLTFLLLPFGYFFYKKDLYRIERKT